MNVLDTFLDKAESKVDAFFSKKWRFAVILPLLLLSLYILYFIFCFKLGDTYTAKELGFATEAKGKAAGIVLIVYVILLAFALAYMIVRKRISGYRLALFFLWLFAGILVYVLGIRNFNNGGYKHDFGTFGLGGHWQIIYEIFNTNKLPEVNLDNQFYQPKFFHATIAAFMKLNYFLFPYGENANTTISVIANGKNAEALSLFTYREYASFESGRIYMAFVGILMGYAYIRILKELKLTGAKMGIASFLLLSVPMNVYVAISGNNDCLAYTLMLYSLLFALRYRSYGKTSSLLFVAICLGLGMETKLNAGIMALPIAFIFLLELIKKAKALKGENGKKDFIRFWIQIAVFAAIVFPLGLGGHIYNAVKYHEPIGYVLNLERNGILKSQHIDNDEFGIFKRLVLFPSGDLFTYIFNLAAGDMKNYPNISTYDYNIWTSFIKYSLFEEHKFINELATPGLGWLFYLGYCLYITLGFLFIVAVIYYAVKLIRGKGKEFFHTSLLGVIFLTGWLSFGYFCWKYPVSCTMNARYAMILYLPIGIGIACFGVDGVKDIIRIIHKAKEQKRAAE